ncbi:MAG: methylmalonyl Co-A mutase-associated GTPase MeaB [Armatimonadota bacterium]|nr:methylmalonyl Co-A mutase-associated GTPase MeaB [Armatimonadota bacterium]MDR7451193.1 methylmalonyl Co-A mutase-associated GTPase MeaB [Armatimonadota bacterium]MDR7467202.1 methylmalonyl Co-A mutase-associated GTPase MeaB [Armatimonadota bacterium]MDR7494870.1 methylmalonyl Co-A mutase-associated GTPase MeaB [Armatimonadota bacterium]MDR7500074.1 methylmalonyl Co-A mutase-associated GTPase MeaB [Armatimonadota bacterium]
MALIDEALAGSHQALARIISLVEDGDPEGQALLRRLHPRTGGAYTVGITGPPGVGKSTLVDALTRLLRSQGVTVAVVAVDPTSPFTGGALLGDRIRMQDHAVDPGVFIRSMATRGSLGGLAPATSDVVRVLDAAGFQIIFIETVGTGQAEVDVVGAADTVVIVLVPGLGDTVQTMKAGVMEIGEIFVVNKADQGDADRTVTEVKMMLALAPKRGGWDPPVLRSVAANGEGVAEVLEAVRRHRAWQEQEARLPARRRERCRREILRAAERRLQVRLLEVAARGRRLEDLTDLVAAGRLDPAAAAGELLKDL